MTKVLARFSNCVGVLAAILFASNPSSANEPPTTRPAILELKDASGVTVWPLELGEARAAVFIFVAVDCPISNAYAPEINRLCERYTAKGVRFYIVHSESNLSGSAALKHARDFAFACPVLMDGKHQLLNMAGAIVTPEAAIIGPKGKVLYRGRIDDLFYALGQQRHEATTHELRDALDAVLAGRDVPVPRTRAVGCAIGE